MPLCGPRCEELGRWQRWAVMPLGWQQLVRQPRSPSALPTSRSVPCYRSIPCSRDDVFDLEWSSGCCTLRRMRSHCILPLRGSEIHHRGFYGVLSVGRGRKPTNQAIKDGGPGAATAMSRLSPPASPERARCMTNRAFVGCRHLMDDMCAVARHGEHVQGRGGSDCGSSLAGRTRVRTTLINTNSQWDQPNEQCGEERVCFTAVPIV